MQFHRWDERRSLVRFESLQGVDCICPRHDFVTLEDAVCAPTADLHDDVFGNSGAAKVARRSAAQIVEQNHQSDPTQG